MKTDYKRVAHDIVSEITTQNIGKNMRVSHNFAFLSQAISSIALAILYLAEVIKDKK